jgi:hypothetical protein
MQYQRIPLGKAHHSIHLGGTGDSDQGSIFLLQTVKMKRKMSFENKGELFCTRPTLNYLMGTLSPMKPGSGLELRIERA